jgi:alpha-glucosidase
LHLYDRDHPDAHAIYRDFRKLLDSYGDGECQRMAMGEIYIPDLREWALFYGEELDELHMPMNFTLIVTPWDAASVRAAADAIEVALPEGAWPNWVLGNHDEHRVASRVGRKQARVAMMLLLTLRGTPTMYYGDELGMEDVPIPPGKVLDPWEKLSPGLGLGRDPARSPMRWDTSPNAGFCPKGVEPWLPMDPNYEEDNVETQKGDPHSMLNFTKKLLELRRSSPTLSVGSYEPVSGVPQGCVAYRRVSDEEGYLVALNLTDRDLVLDLPAKTMLPLLISTHLDREGKTSPTSFRLRGGEGCVLEFLQGPED